MVIKSRHADIKSRHACSCSKSWKICQYLKSESLWKYQFYIWSVKEKVNPVTNTNLKPEHILLFWWLMFLFSVFLCFMFIKTKRKSFTYLFHTLKHMTYGYFCFEAESVPSGFHAVKHPPPFCSGAFQNDWQIMR